MLRNTTAADQDLCPVSRATPPNVSQHRKARWSRGQCDGQLVQQGQAMGAGGACGGEPWGGWTLTFSSDGMRIHRIG
jgi:hypothetical protein